MVNDCIVAGCTSTSRKGPILLPDGLTVGFYRIPKIVTREGPAMEDISRRRQQAWLKAINRPKFLRTKSLSPPTIPQWYRVCSRHFISGRPAKMMYQQDPDWVPSKDLGHDMVICRNGRYDKRPIRKRKWDDDGEEEKESPTRRRVKMKVSLPALRKSRSPKASAIGKQPSKSTAARKDTQLSVPVNATDSKEGNSGNLEDNVLGMQPTSPSDVDADRDETVRLPVESEEDDGVDDSGSEAESPQAVVKEEASSFNGLLNKCLYCTFEHPSLTELGRHVKWKHSSDVQAQNFPETVDDLDKDPCFVCGHCDYRSFSSECLDEHSRISHPGIAPQYIVEPITKAESTMLRQADALFYSILFGRTFESDMFIKEEAIESEMLTMTCESERNRSNLNSNGISVHGGGGNVGGDTLPQSTIHGHGHQTAITPGQHSSSVQQNPSSAFHLELLVCDSKGNRQLLKKSNATVLKDTDS